MKKKNCLMIAYLACCLTGCSETVSKQAITILANSIEPQESRFETIQSERQYSGKIVYDKETMMQYWYSEGTQGSASILMPLVDSEGKPILYVATDKENTENQ